VILMKRISKEPWFSKKSKNPMVQGQPVTWQGWVVFTVCLIVCYLGIFIMFIDVTIGLILTILAPIVLIIIALLTSSKRENK